MSIRFNGPPDTERPEPPPLVNQFGEPVGYQTRPPKKNKKQDDPHIEEAKPDSIKPLVLVVLLACCAGFGWGVDYLFKFVYVEDGQIACVGTDETDGGPMFESTAVRIVPNTFDQTKSFDIRTLRSDRLFKVEYRVRYSIQSYRSTDLCSETRYTAEYLSNAVGAMVHSAIMKKFMHYDIMRYSRKRIAREIDSDMSYMSFPSPLHFDTFDLISLKRVKESVK